MKRREAIIGIAVMLTGALFGCGRTERDEIGGVYENSSSATDTDASSDMEGAQIPEHESYVIKAANGSTYTVEADVSAEGYGNMSLYEVSPIEFNDSVLAAYAEALFDDGKYERVKPYKICSMEELLAEQVFLEEQGVQNWQSNLGDVDYYMNIYDEANVEEYPEGQLIYTDEKGEYCMLRGYVDGELWSLQYERVSESIDDFTQRQETGLLISPIPEHEHINTNCSYEDMDAAYLGNKLDYEEACLQAENMMARLGIEDMRQAISWQISYVEDGQLVLDGYKLIYTRETDGVLGMNAENDWITSENMEVAGQEFIYVYVDSEGVGRIEYISPYELKNEMSADVSLLDYEQISGIAQEYMEEYLTEWTDGTYNAKIDSIEFRYAVMCYDEKYVLMPVWLFYENVFAGYRHVEIGINAVTGELLDLSQSTVYLIIR